MAPITGKGESRSHSYGWVFESGLVLTGHLEQPCDTQPPCADAFTDCTLFPECLSLYDKYVINFIDWNFIVCKHSNFLF